MRLIYYIFLLFIRVFSLVPFTLFYVISDILFYVLYYFIPYRKKVIIQNIERSFPELSANERAGIIKGFYRNLCDILVEGLKGFSLNEAQLLQRYRVINPEVIDDLFDKGHDVIAVGAHYANWEWGIMAAPLQIKHGLYAFYTRLTNPYMDEYMRKSRNKYGTQLVTTRDVRKAFSADKSTPTAYFFGADQSPSNVKGSHWMEFLNQDTACSKGPEFFARRYKMPVVYFDVQRVKRGHYTVKLSMMETTSGDTVSGEITEKYMQTLEAIIRQKPEDYLWSHRRWKKSRVV